MNIVNALAAIPRNGAPAQPSLQAQLEADIARWNASYVAAAHRRDVTLVEYMGHC